MKNLVQMSVGEIAEWLHNNYEEISKKENWKTQEKCRVKFEDLPKENKEVMLKLAQRIFNELVAYLTGYKKVG
jgi:hypothetical protein